MARASRGRSRAAIDAVAGLPREHIRALRLRVERIHEDNRAPLRAALAGLPVELRG